MARPIKSGLDYFSHDVDAANDEKIEALRALYGNDGYAFYFIILERIYRTSNAELDISNPAIAAGLVKKIRISEKKFAKILKTAFSINLLDETHYKENQSLTSDGIKRRFLETQDLRGRWRKNKARVFRVENPVENHMENPEKTPEKTPQSKEKKSKEKKSKVNNNNPPLPPLSGRDGCGCVQIQNFDTQNEDEMEITPCKSSESLTVKTAGGSGAQNKKPVAHSTTLTARERPLFESFWATYPKKRNKGQAEKAFKKVAPDEQLMEVILATIEQATKSAQWLKDDGQYVPYPATWLNAKGWEDEYAVMEANNGQSSTDDRYNIDDLYWSD